MQTDILLKQITSSLEELKIAIEKFEKHPAPSTSYTQNLYHTLNLSNKLVSAYLVLKEQKDLSPDLDLHIKLMSLPTSETQTKPAEPVIAETIVNIESITETQPEPTIPEKIIEKEFQRITVNINDKFRFINELFRAETNEYNIAMEELNTLNTIESSIAYLKGLKTIYEWNDDHEMVKKLFSLTQKRFL